MFIIVVVVIHTAPYSLSLSVSLHVSLSLPISIKPIPSDGISAHASSRCVDAITAAASLGSRWYFLSCGIHVTPKQRHISRHKILLEPQNGFAPNSRGRRVWSVARKSLNVKVKGQRSRSPGTENALCTPITPAATEWSCLLHESHYSALSTGGLRACGLCLVKHLCSSTQLL